MSKIKILCVFGTRPEAAKMAPVIQELNKEENRRHAETQVCVTAQHREMLDQVLDIFKIKPDYDLNIMKAGQTLSDITTNVLAGLGPVLEEARPDLVLVHGDTTTSFAAALTAFYNKIPCGHVEAGLRSFDKYQPFPEEINRKLTGVLADLHFSPTPQAKDNLLRENVDPSKIFVTGNTALDCFATTIYGGPGAGCGAGASGGAGRRLRAGASGEYRYHCEKLNSIDFTNTRVILMTAHRRENLGAPLVNICRAVRRLAARYKDTLFVYPVHFNRLVRDTARKELEGAARVVLTDPLDLCDMHNLMNKSFLVLTDSGGLQEEAPGLRKPVIVLRNVTERPEGLSAGTLKLAGTEESVVFETAARLLDDPAEYNRMASAKNPYGDGRASIRIAGVILRYFDIKETLPEEFC
ncbi:MAG: UDP-N-acetylglucosamine 2-epimerase (non-hydrolyzing) [Clostridiales bacterium]|jgi:UDP-N-acetylglucosamine 2-epimerase (non-hydrolysing)|nr:UDP-N-acetylglucosamine 2-epimerase (non-hydrolyzing) [Clostridiales bacterium]